MYKCLRNHPSPPKPFSLLSWGTLTYLCTFSEISFKVPQSPFLFFPVGNPTYLRHIFRDIFKVKASFTACGSFWGRKFSGHNRGPG